jgi:hypothetical protein
MPGFAGSATAGCAKHAIADATAAQLAAIIESLLMGFLHFLCCSAQDRCGGCSLET